MRFFIMWVTQRKLFYPADLLVWSKKSFWCPIPLRDTNIQCHVHVVAGNDQISRTKFTVVCSKSFSFILWSLSTEKIAEAGRKFTTLKNELYVAGSLKVGPSLNTLATSKKMTLVPKPSDKVKAKTKKKASELKFAFGEFYLSLVLLQNYQVLSS